MEPAGLALGAVGVVIAFKGALDTYLLIEDFFEERKSGCGYLALLYHIEMTKLGLWGKACKVNDEAAYKESTLIQKDEEVKKIIIRILGEIEICRSKAEKLVTKHEISMHNLAENISVGDMKPGGDLSKAMSKLTTRPTSRFRWHIKGKAEFEGVINKIQRLIKSLEDFSLTPSQVTSLADALPSQALAAVDSDDLLQAAQEGHAKLDPAFIMSARTKLLQRQPSTKSSNSATLVASNQFELHKISNVGIIARNDGHLPVYVEWNVVTSGQGSEKYTERIKALAYLLEQVSEPIMRLPPCYGVFEDLAYEKQHGSKRFGYVFGVPSASLGQSISYDSNLRQHPPQTLRQLIEGEKTTDIPPLGDRFRLAHKLAVAFSLFHTAGWLHKGLTSSSVIFFRQADSNHISVTEPFITGFQYSRPQQAASLSQGPLDDKATEQYYHPDAHKGFSKRRDLYSLGVVLCEIGRWALVEKVSKDRKKLLTDRQAWKDYLVDKVAEDLGWRMGKKYQSAVKTLLEGRLPDDDEGDLFFTQQFTEKVLKSLGSCSA